VNKYEYCIKFTVHSSYSIKYYILLVNLINIALMGKEKTLQEVITISTIISIDGCYSVYVWLSLDLKKRPIQKAFILILRLHHAVSYFQIVLSCTSNEYDSPSDQSLMQLAPHHCIEHAVLISVVVFLSVQMKN